MPKKHVHPPWPKPHDETHKIHVFFRAYTNLWAAAEAETEAEVEPAAPAAADESMSATCLPPPDELQILQMNFTANFEGNGRDFYKASKKQLLYWMTAEEEESEQDEVDDVVEEREESRHPRQGMSSNFAAKYANFARDLHYEIHRYSYRMDKGVHRQACSIPV
ncbi:hypothetical protein KEM54_003161 [Ascosphaera aggregata]|nr:hypothetical protein KEM54_003161 [Ascosphaera aggregata]